MYLFFLIGIIGFTALSIGGAVYAEENSNGKTNIVLPNSQFGQGFYDISPSRTKRSIQTNPQQFLSEIKQGAQENWQFYGILPSITAAQAALESGWGQNLRNLQIISSESRALITVNM